MKIALVVTGLGLGGAETQICSLADHLVKAGHQVCLFSVVDPTEVWPSSSAVEVIELGCKRTLGGFLSAILKLSRALRKFKPDVVHSHMVHANLISRLSRLLVKVPVHISTAHNIDEGGKALMSAYRFTDPLTHLTTNVSEEAAEAFVAKRAVPESKMLAVHNGIDTVKFVFDNQARDKIRSSLGIQPGQTMLLAVGRLEPQKDYPNLLNAFSQFQEKHANSHLVIVGKGYLLDELKQLTLTLRIGGAVTFAGAQSNVSEWYSAADVFVLSSAFEGFGLVVAEAMSTGLPVVATNCGGVAEVVGEHGRLVAPQSALQLTNALSDVVSDLDGKRRDSARSWIESTYSMTSVAEKWESIYQRFLSK